MCDGAESAGVCEQRGCVKWIACPDAGNCLRRVDRVYSMQEVRVAIGGVSTAYTYRLLHRAAAKLVMGMRERMVDSTTGPYFSTARRKGVKGAE